MGVHEDMIRKALTDHDTQKYVRDPEAQDMELEGAAPEKNRAAAAKHTRGTDAYYEALSGVPIDLTPVKPKSAARSRRK